MLFTRGTSKGERSLDERWVEIGKTAKETTFSLDEWSEIDIARWDLDEPERTPTGAQNPRTWTYDPPMRRVNEPDDAERPDIRERYNR